MNKKNKPASAKKDLRARITNQLHTALSEFKGAVHEKKLQKLVKKAARLLADGLHHNKPVTPAVNKTAVAVKKAAPKKAAKKTTKKAPAKKAAPKKTAKKK